MNNHNQQTTPVYQPDMTLAKKSHQDLLNLLSQLSSKLSGVSKHVDEEFLSAYRVHMISIQQELKNLKQQQLYEEELLKSDVIVAKLENEKQWFIEECKRLEENLLSIKNDYNHLKSKYNNIKKEKKYMSNILKSLIKKNKILSTEIEYQTSLTLSKSINSISSLPSPSPKTSQLNQTTSRSNSSLLNLNKINTSTSNPSNKLLEEDDENEIEKKINDDDDDDEDIKIDDDDDDSENDRFINNTLDSLSDFNHYSNMNEEDLLKLNEDNVESNQNLLLNYSSPLILPPSYNNSSFSPSPSRSPPTSSSNYRNKKKNLSLNKSANLLLSTDKLFTAKAGNLKGSKSATSLFNPSPSPYNNINYSQPTEVKKSLVESSLEDSIRFVFKEVLRRKKESAALASTQTKSVFVSDIDQLGGISQLGLNQLTENDRFAVIVRLLSEDTNVLETVLNRLALNYPHIIAQNSSISEL